MNTYSLSRKGRFTAHFTYIQERKELGFHPLTQIQKFNREERKLAQDRWRDIGPELGIQTAEKRS
jgi:hypothetical protein